MKKIVYIVISMLTLITSCKDGLKKEAVYEGQDISDMASILRDKKTKAAVLTINTGGSWAIYPGYSTDAINYKKGFSGTSKGLFPLDVNDSVRVYFQLVTNNGKAILAEKHLPMEGGYNFRDLGGIKTVDNRYVKWGKFLRTDDLAHLTDFDLSYLSSIPVTSVVDFRTKREIELNPDKLPSSVKRTIELNVNPGNLNVENLDLGSLKMNFDSVMIKMSESFVTDTAIIKQYKEFFSVLQDESNMPLIFHCSAGKDRTGIAAALILFALGVDEGTVIKDYLLSNVYLGNKYKDLKDKYPHLEPLFVVKPEYMQKSIDTMKERYGSIDNYLTNELGVDVNKFRQMYLY